MSTSTSVHTFVAILATHLDVQKKLQGEVDNEIGSR